MRILSFDTTNNCISIALLQGSNVVAQRLLSSTGSERQESVTLLLPGMDEMLQQAAWKKSDLDSLVVGIGPGSFTGIRIAVVTARTLAQALNLPLLGVSLLDCYAAKIAEEATCEFAVVLSGGRGHFYFAAYSSLVAGDAQTNPSQAAACGSPKQSVAELVKPQHGTLSEMESALSGIKTWMVDASLLQVLCESATIVELPKVENIAAFQGVLAWQRVALSKSSEGNSLASSGVSEENGRDAKILRESLLVDYPYSIVEPLYLRGASVTLKGSDGKAAATT